jgi:MraZ protein
MFRGRFEHSIDAKGRLSLPAKFREVFSLIGDERLIITNFDHCLWAYPINEWQKIEDKVSNLPQFKPEVIALQRVFISAAVESGIDKQGRIMIPPSLRDYAELKKNTSLKLPALSPGNLTPTFWLKPTSLIKS